MLPQISHTHAELLNIEEIPKYLQFEGKIQRIFLTKWETETCINEIWEHREDMLMKRGQKEQTYGFAHDFDPDYENDSPFSEFFWEYILVFG